MIETEIVRAPYAGVAILHQWSAHIFAAEIDENGLVTASGITDEQLDIAESIESRFDPDGYLTERLTFAGAVETVRETFGYDSAHRLISRITEFVQDELAEEEHRQYDETGRPITAVIRYADGSTRTTSWTYDDAHRTSETTTVSPDGIEERIWELHDATGRSIERKTTANEVEIHEYFVYDDKGLLMEKGVVIDGVRKVGETVTYNSAGLEVLWQEFDDEGELSRRRTTEYEDGRASSDTLEDTFSDDVITTHEYDSAGHEIRMHTQAGSFEMESFRLYDNEGRIATIAAREIIVDDRRVTRHPGLGVDTGDATTTWFEYEVA
jgi:YD repeat-containing protein